MTSNGGWWIDGIFSLNVISIKCLSSTWTSLLEAEWQPWLVQHQGCRVRKASSIWGNDSGITWFKGNVCRDLWPFFAVRRESRNLWVGIRNYCGKVEDESLIKGHKHPWKRRNAILIHPTLREVWCHPWKKCLNYKPIRKTWQRMGGDTQGIPTHSETKRKKGQGRDGGRGNWEGPLRGMLNE